MYKIVINDDIQHEYYSTYTEAYNTYLSSDIAPSTTKIEILNLDGLMSRLVFVAEVVV